MAKPAAHYREVERTITEYEEHVLSGAIPVGKLHRAAVERQRRDLIEGGQRGLWFDRAAAHRVLEFVPICRHSKGEWAGQPLDLSPWQMWATWVLYGWRRADGFRRFRRAYLEVPRKNGKSTWISALGLYHLVADNEPGAEVYIAATTRGQANIVFKEAASMIRKSPELSSRLERFKDVIVYEAQDAKWQALDGKPDTKDGFNPSAAFLDELHAHKDRGMYDVLESALGARRQPLMLAITTAGGNRHGICWEVREVCRQILEGLFENDSQFALICHCDDELDWTDPRAWEQANPNLGLSLKLDYLQEQCRLAKQRLSFRTEFLRKNLNRWADSFTCWLNLERWRAAGRDADGQELDPVAWRAEMLARLRGRACYGGLDLASVIDLAAYVLVFPPQDEGDRLIVLPWFFAPQDTATARAEIDRVPYLEWAERGFLELTAGDVIDTREIRAQIQRTAADYGVQEIGYDSYQGTHLALAIRDEDGIVMVPIPQTTKFLNEPSKKLEEMVLKGALDHGNNPVLTWMAGNCQAFVDGSGAIRPDKKRSAEKIDGIVALVMALHRSLFGGESGSVYDTEDPKEI